LKVLPRDAIRPSCFGLSFGTFTSLFCLGVAEWDEKASEMDTSDVFELTTLRTS